MPLTDPAALYVVIPHLLLGYLRGMLAMVERKWKRSSTMSKPDDKPEKPERPDVPPGPPEKTPGEPSEPPRPPKHRPVG